MPETTNLPTPPAPAAKKANVNPGRPQLGEIYIGDHDYDDVFSEFSFGPPTEAEPGAEEAVLKKLRQPKGDLKEAWKHLERRWKFVIIFSMTGMIILGILWFLLSYFLPQATWLNKHVPWNQSKKGPMPEDPALQARFWSEGAEDVSASPTVSIPVLLPPTVTAVTSTVETSSPGAPTVTTVSAPESTFVLVPMSFVA